jgi:hypothetical protein
MVFENASELICRIPCDGKRYRIRIVGYEPQTDVTVDLVPHDRKNEFIVKYYQEERVLTPAEKEATEVDVNVLHDYHRGYK